MGCCYSLFSLEDPQKEVDQNHDEAASGGGGGEEGSSLTKFSFSDLKIATNNFSSENIISHEVTNIVYKGLLPNRDSIAVKRFMDMSWPDPKQFVEEAKRVGKIRHKRVVNLIGYCCDGHERLLVAEFMSNDTLAKCLFHRGNQTMEWPKRFRVAYAIAEALDHCSNEGFASYNNLSAYTILFDEDGDASLSCFGFMKEMNSYRRTNGSVNPKSVIYRFGTVLVNLLSGKQVPPSHAPEMINGKSVIELMDPNLDENFTIQEAIVVFKLATRCLQNENRESLNTRELFEALEALQTKTETTSHETIEMRKDKELCLTQHSPLAEACLRRDLEAIHGILVKTEYEDDEEALDLSFEEWTQDMKDLQEVRICGDQAFLDHDFKTATDCYSEFIEGRRTVYPSVYARRSLSYLFCNQSEKALLDGMHAQGVYSDWPTALYLQSVALSDLNMNVDSADVFQEATLLEAKRHQK